MESGRVVGLKKYGHREELGQKKVQRFLNEPADETTEGKPADLSKDAEG